MGLTYQTTHWTDSLWSGHLDYSASGSALVRDMTQRQHDFPGFAEDIHAKLYLKHKPPEMDGGPQWANDLHRTAEEIPEWKTLRARCASNGFAAGLAAETILQEIKNEIPQEEKKDKQDENGRPSGTERRTMRQAMRHASRAVSKAESIVESLCNAIGTSYGSEPGKPETLESIDHVRKAYNLIKDNRQLKKIAELAGRLSRIASSEKRTKVKEAVGEIKGITQGGDIPRLLPSELVGLRCDGMQRIQSLQRIMDRQALQYLMQGEQTMARGPIIVCVDYSSSMIKGNREQWAKAVCLALLTTASEQRRTWHMIAFETVIKHEATVEPGRASLGTVTDALCQKASGGTEFDPPLERALELMETAPTMHKADIIFITDGEATLSDKLIEQYQKTTQQEGLSVYVIGVGEDAALEVLKPIATETYNVQALDSDSVTIAPIISLQG